MTPRETILFQKHHAEVIISERTTNAYMNEWFARQKILKPLRHYLNQVRLSSKKMSREERERKKKEHEEMVARMMSHD